MVVGFFLLSPTISAFCSSLSVEDGSFLNFLLSHRAIKLGVSSQLTHFQPTHNVINQVNSYWPSYGSEVQMYAV